MDKPKQAADTPFVVDVEAGKTYAWCSCGLSSKQPYCDGSHTPTGMRPVIEKFEESKKVAWCGCKASSNGAFCDGTHSKLVKE
jgi:CDGSH-type Zn-finger protein